MPQSNDDLFSRNLTHTQQLLREAEEVLQRLARNRAAMARPRVMVPALVEPPPPHVPEPPPPLELLAKRRRAPNEITHEERSGFTRLFAKRGFIVNADLRAISGLDVAQASVRLRVFRNAELLRQDGLGSLTKYYPGPRWQPLELEPHAAPPPNPAEINVTIGTPRDVQALANLRAQQVQPMTVVTSSEASGKIENLLRQLRSRRNVLLLASDVEGNLVGYLHCGLDEKRGDRIGSIYAFYLAPGAHQNARLRLFETAKRWLTQQGALRIRVQVPHEASPAQAFFAEQQFNPASVEMELFVGATVKT
ncbi:MAG: hypothetical protein SF187_16815 [Deltaproteobacteria bacterium]|nr:hypothetical protein [Deltaproteobacteria bacterium]